MTDCSQGKRKVGRPRIDTELVEIDDKRNDFVRCRRSAINRVYYMRAMMAIYKKEKYEILPGFEYLRASHSGLNTIYYALGQIDDEEMIRILAKKICDEKMPAKKAVPMITKARNLWNTSLVDEE